MAGSDLDRAWRSLLRHARREGIRVLSVASKRFRLNAPGTVACYHPPSRTIAIVKKRWGKRDKIYTLAHELGHAADFDKKPKKKMPLHKKALTLFHMYANGQVRLHPKYKPDFRKYILGLETAAFDEGDRILEELGISLPPDWMRDQRSGTLRAYRSIFRRRT
jgi:hypothetical protein